LHKRAKFGYQLCHRRLKLPSQRVTAGRGRIAKALPGDTPKGLQIGADPRASRAGSAEPEQFCRAAADQQDLFRPDVAVS
jgi:hypothetical protein